MRSHKKNIALISPSGNTYSETFIQAHKAHLSGNIKYYYGKPLPTHLEGSGTIINLSPLNRIKYKILKSVGFNYSFSESELIKSFKREKISVVLAEYGMTGVGILPVCKKLGVPLIVHFHGLDASVNKIIEKYQQLYREMFSYASRIIVVSKKMHENLNKLGAPKEKLAINTYGPDDGFFSIQPDYYQKKIIGIGRFVDKKAPYYTILAFAEVLKKHKDATLFLGGDGVLLDSCKNLVRHFNIEKSVKFLGIISQSQFKEELLTARAYVQHSITAGDGDMEGAPVAILEASAAGLPVISTYHAGIPEIVLHNQTGLLVQEHDVEGMANNMIRVLDDISLAKKLGASGKERIKNHFSMKRHIDLLNQIISEV